MICNLEVIGSIPVEGSSLHSSLSWIKHSIGWKEFGSRPKGGGEDRESTFSIGMNRLTRGIKLIVQIHTDMKLCYVVENEMPLDGQEVLVSCSGIVSIDTFDEDYYDFEDMPIEDVDAWMPMPKSYKKQKLN